MTTIASQLRGGTREQLEHLSATLSVEDEWARALAEPEPAPPAPSPRHPAGPRRNTRPGPDRASGPRARTMQCRTCSGQFTAEDGTGRPWGWYSVSVSVPPELSKAGKPFLWIGTYCSARCLAAAAPVIAAAEAAAREAYTADRPQRSRPRDSEPSIAALMRQAPRGR